MWRICILLTHLFFHIIAACCLFVTELRNLWGTFQCIFSRWSLISVYVTLSLKHTLRLISSNLMHIRSSLWPCSHYCTFTCCHWFTVSCRRTHVFHHRLLVLSGLPSESCLAPLWPMVSGPDGLTGWAIMTWWVDWLSRHFSSIIHQLLLKLFLLCQVKSDFDETWYKWYEDKGLQSR